MSSTYEIIVGTILLLVIKHQMEMKKGTTRFFSSFGGEE
jgi:hypothetical protein